MDRPFIVQGQPLKKILIYFFHSPYGHDLNVKLLVIQSSRTNHRFVVRRTDIRYLRKTGYIFWGAGFPERIVSADEYFFEAQLFGLSYPLFDTTYGPYLAAEPYFTGKAIVRG